MEIQEILTPAISVGVGVVGWWVKGIRADFKELKKNMESLRAELRSELQHYTHKETCQAHREGLQAQIDSLRKEAEASLAHAVNDTHRMRALYDHMTQAERKAHAAQCLFKNDMEGIG